MAFVIYHTDNELICIHMIKALMNGYKKDKNSIVSGRFVSIYLSEDGDVVTIVEYNFSGSLVNSGATSTISRYYFINDIWVQLGSSIHIPSHLTTQEASQVKMENNTIFIGWSNQECLIKQF